MVVKGALLFRQTPMPGSPQPRCSMRKHILAMKNPRLGRRAVALVFSFSRVLCLTSLPMFRMTLCDTLANTTLRISPQKAAPALLQRHAATVAGVVSLHG